MPVLYTTVLADLLQPLRPELKQLWHATYCLTTHTGIVPKAAFFGLLQFFYFVFDF